MASFGKQIAQSIARVGIRSFHTSHASNYKVAVVGASGGIGAPLSLHLKQNPYISKLALYDVAPNIAGVAADLSHIDTAAEISHHQGNELSAALKGSDIIVVPAGVPRKPGMSRDDLFATNAGIVANIAKEAATSAPNASLCIISNPVNSTVPICAEVLKRHNVYNPKKLFGVTTLDVVRANCFLSQVAKLDVTKTNVTVVGGHAGITILPLLSQVPGISLTQEQKEKLTNRIMFGGDEVVKAKNGGGSATLSMAYAAARFTHSLLRALRGESNVIECSFVQSELYPDVPFFSSPVELGPEGAKKIHPIGQIDAYEQQLLEQLFPELKASIKKGIDFVKQMHN